MFRQKKPPKWTRILRNGLYLVVGDAMVAFAVTYFYIPNDLMVGGATGFALILYRMLGIDTALTVFVFNLLLMIAGAVFVGRQFLIYTALGSMIYPLCLKVFDLLRIAPPQIEDMMIRIVCAAILVGVGVGFVIKGGGSTGGSDELAVILNKLFSLPVTTVITVFDMGVLCVAFLFSSLQSVIYSIITLLIEMFVMNRVLLSGKGQVQFFIVTKKPEEVRQMLLRRANAGVTLVKIQTGYLGENSDALLCVIPTRKLHKTQEWIHDIDERAFITISEIREVRGNGFSYEQIPMPAPAERG
jgi:uncharacterized membrane-anchored protein YitT (DUF2179 family)